VACIAEAARVDWWRRLDRKAKLRISDRFHDFTIHIQRDEMRANLQEMRMSFLSVFLAALVALP
jgi:hypothetical protein